MIIAPVEDNSQVNNNTARAISISEILTRAAFYQLHSGIR